MIALLLALALAGSTPAPVAPPATQATLAATLKTAKPGDEIRVSGEITGPLIANFAEPGITITAEPGATLGPDARTKWFTVQGSGMTFRGFAARSGGGAAVGVLSGSSRIAFDQLDFTGLGALEVGGGSGISARDSADISVTNSRFRDATGGVSFNNVLGGRIAGNDFRDLWYDAIHVDTTGRIAVENNTITDFRGPPLHLDAIQFSCAKATTPVAGLVIRGNRYTRGTGSPAQFIFMSDCAPGYTDFKITGNADFGGAFHGVTIVKASNGEIGDNFLQASSALWAGQLLVPGIRLDLPGPGVVVRDDNRWAGTGLKPAEDTTGLVAWTRRLDDPRDVALAAAQAAIADLKAQLASALKGGDDSRAVAASLQSALDLATARGAALEARLAGVAAMAATPVP